MNLESLLITIGIPVVLFVLGKFLPNSWFKKRGVSVGKGLSKKGRSVMGVNAWEKLENTFLGALVAFVDGVYEGADQDDDIPEGGSKAKNSSKKVTRNQSNASLKGLLMLFLLLPVLSFSQVGEDDDTFALYEQGRKFEYAILVNLTQFYFDGNYRVLETPFAGGARYRAIPGWVEPGLFLAPVVKSNEDKNPVAEVSYIFDVNVFDGRIGVGFGGRFWSSSGDGVVNPFKGENAFLTFSFQLADLGGV